MQNINDKDKRLIKIAIRNELERLRGQIALVIMMGKTTDRKGILASAYRNELKALNGSMKEYTNVLKKLI
jgi:hypothetical protein